MSSLLSSTLSHQHLNGRADCANSQYSYAFTNSLFLASTLATQHLILNAKIILPRLTQTKHAQIHVAILYFFPLFFFPASNPALSKSSNESSFFFSFFFFLGNTAGPCAAALAAASSAAFFSAAFLATLAARAALSLALRDSFVPSCSSTGQVRSAESEVSGGYTYQLVSLIVSKCRQRCEHNAIYDETISRKILL